VMVYPWDWRDEMAPLLGPQHAKGHELGQEEPMEWELQWQEQMSEEQMSEEQMSEEQMSEVQMSEVQMSEVQSFQRVGVLEEECVVGLGQLEEEEAEMSWSLLVPPILDFPWAR